MLPWFELSPSRFRGPGYVVRAGQGPLSCLGVGYWTPGSVEGARRPATGAALAARDPDRAAHERVYAAEVGVGLAGLGQRRLRVGAGFIPIPGYLPRSQPLARAQRLGEVLGQLRLGLDPLAGERMNEAEARRVQELALEAVPARVAVARVARDRVPIAAKCTRIWCVRPVSRRASTSVSAGSASITVKCVRASRAPRPRTARFSGARWSRPSGASIVPERERGRPSISAR